MPKFLYFKAEDLLNYAEHLSLSLSSNVPLTVEFNIANKIIEIKEIESHSNPVCKCSFPFKSLCNHNFKKFTWTG